MFPFKKQRFNVKPKAEISQMNRQILTAPIFAETIAEKIPQVAVAYCTSLWSAKPFSFSISKTRSSCLGNYKYQNGHHTISINHDLNPYNFLITFIHEVAHQHVFIDYPIAKRKRPAPHGLEWKTRFQKLISPLLNETVFPPSILVPLAKHMINPPASSTRDANLMKALKAFDSGLSKPRTYLESVKHGQSFVFKDRKFLKLETKRTRAKCRELASNRLFTIPLMAEVSEVEKNTPLAIKHKIEVPEKVLMLRDLACGQTFFFNNRKFKKIKARRTRCLCLEIASNNEFTIPLIAEVKPI